MAYPPQWSQYPPQQSAPPVDQSSVVIMQQPMETAPMKRTWTNELCGCFDDWEICLPATVIPAFYQCSVMDDFGESCCVAWPCLLGPQMSLLALRYHFRNKNNIEGSLMDDCMAVTCCYQCALCQLMREHKSLKYRVEAPTPQTMQHGRENMGYH